MDNFSLLGLPRQPWFDPARLKAIFVELSARLHPDRVLASDRKNGPTPPAVLPN